MSEADVLPPNAFALGHRVVFGATDSGEAFARVSFFEAYDFAFRLGLVAGFSGELLIVDLDPRASGPRPNDNLVARRAAVPSEVKAALSRFVEDQEAVFKRVEFGVLRVLNVGHERAWRLIQSEVLPKNRS